MNSKPGSRDWLKEHLREVPPFRALLRSVECELLRREAGPLLREPLLDLGCGDGHFASVAFDRPPFAGMDPDRASLLEARARQSHRHLIASSGSFMPWPENTFATIVANSVLEHIPDLDATLGEARRVLKSGGVLILTVPSEFFGEMLFGTSLFRALKLNLVANAYSRWFNRHSRHFHTDPPDRWRRRLEERGFEVMTCEYYFSPKSHRIFDLAHYLSLPCLLNRKMTGKWVLLPNSWIHRFWYRILLRYCDSSFRKEGAYLFLVGRKRVMTEGS